MRVSPSTLLFLLLANLAMPPVAEAQISNADSVLGGSRAGHETEYRNEALE